MKKLILMFWLQTLISCVTDYKPDKIENFTIINNSLYNVEIIPYSAPNTSQLYENRVILTPGNTFFKQFRTNPQSSSNKTFASAISNNLFEIQKVDIVFNNIKKVTYETCFFEDCSEPRNIFNNFDDLPLNEVYTITNLDYDNAIDCGGNCN